jgi:hypothetical protein
LIEAKKYGALCPFSAPIIERNNRKYMQIKLLQDLKVPNTFKDFDIFKRGKTFILNEYNKHLDCDYFIYKKGKKTVSIHKPRNPTEYHHVSINGSTKGGDYEGFGYPFTAEVFEIIPIKKQLTLF